MVDLAKLGHAVTYTMWLYVKNQPADRVQRPFEDGDTEVLVTLIKEINGVYQVAKNQYGKSADFMCCKEEVLNRQNLDLRTGNFYSSVLANYFRWRQRKYQSEYEEKIPYLDALAAFKTYCSTPKHH